MGVCALSAKLGGVSTMGLEQFSSIILWLGSDVMTSDVMAIFARKIGEEVCSVVGGQHPCALAAVRKKLNVVEIVNSARSCQNDFITSFEKLREEVRGRKCLL